MEQYLKLLGHRVRDVVTEFEGVVDSVAFDLYGCVQAVISPKMNIDDPDKAKSRYFDVKRLVVLSTHPVLDQPSFSAPGQEIGAANKPERSNAR